MNQLKKIKSSLSRINLKGLSEDGFHKIFDHVNQYGVKKSVDKIGIDRFINQCAGLAAGTGVISGSGGAITMAIGIPADIINTITQQFRVTLGIVYYYRGSYQIGFEEFMSIVGASVKVEAGVALTKTMMESIAEKLLLKMGSEVAGRLVPVVGGIIGGTANFLFIKGVADSVKKMHQVLPVNKE